MKVLGFTKLEGMFVIQLLELHPPDGIQRIADRLVRQQAVLGRTAVVIPAGGDKLLVFTGPAQLALQSDVEECFNAVL